jgi:DNA-binding transcriptional ArsR family regulator
MNITEQSQNRLTVLIDAENAQPSIVEALLPTPTAKRILAVLRKYKILTTLQEPSGRKSAIYMFDELLRITEGDNET